MKINYFRQKRIIEVGIKRGHYDERQPFSQTEHCTNVAPTISHGNPFYALLKQFKSPLQVVS